MDGKGRQRFGEGVEQWQLAAVVGRVCGRLSRPGRIGKKGVTLEMTRHDCSRFEVGGELPSRDVGRRMWGGWCKSQG